MAYFKKFCVSVHLGIVVYYKFPGLSLHLDLHFMPVS